MLGTGPEGWRPIASRHPLPTAAPPEPLWGHSRGGTCAALPPPQLSPCLPSRGRSDGAAICHEKQTAGCGNRNSFLFPPAPSGHFGAGCAKRWDCGEACSSPGLAVQRWQPAGIRKSGRARSPLVLLSGKECGLLPGAREGFAAFCGLNSQWFLMGRSLQHNFYFIFPKGFLNRQMPMK